MFHNLFSLAAQGTLRKKRSSILVFGVLLLSFSCAIVSLSLTESMRSTNEQLRLDTYGTWYLAIPDGKDGDETWLAGQDWAEEIGHACQYALLGRESAAFGTIDRGYASLGRIEPLSGHLPQQRDEIAIEQSLLRSLGYDETPGQTITLSLRLRQSDEDVYGYGEFSFTLCGVLPNTSQHWSFNQNRNARLQVSAVVTDEAAQAVWDDINCGMQREGWSKAEEPRVQYLVGVSEHDRQRAQEAASRYMSETRDQYTEDIAPCVNYLAFPLLDTSASGSELFTLLIAAAALTAVLCAYLMQLHAGSARRARRLRGALVLLLLAAFGTAALYMLSGSAASFYQKNFYETQPEYILSWKSGTTSSRVVPAELLDTVRGIPGVARADGFLETHGNMALRYAGEGGEVQQRVSFYVLDIDCWDDLPTLGDDRDAFLCGEMVLLCFPNDFGEDDPMPTGAVTLTALGQGCTAELSAQVHVDTSRSRTRVVRGQSFAEPYTVIASEQFLKRLLAALPEGGEWAGYVGGGTFGYPRVYVDAADSAAELSTGQALQALCTRHGIRVEDLWSAMQQPLQLCRQELIMLFSCGGCIALITLLLLAGAISMETEQERRGITILRVLGMSKKQLRRRVLGRALRRGSFAAVFGWMACFCFYVWEEVHSGFYDAAAAAAAYWPRLQRLGVSPQAAVLTTLACLLAALLTSLFAKRGLKESTLLK